MKYGCRAHDYGRFSPAGLAATLRQAGYDAAQLALPKAIEGIDSLAQVRPDQIEAVRAAFDGSGIEITVLSCYQDLGSADAETRRAAVAAVCHALTLQKQLGARQVGSESSCGDLTQEEKAAALPLLTDSVLRIVECAARLDAVFALEPVYVHALGTAQALRALMARVADPAHFKVIFDPVNVLTAETAARQSEVWPEWIETIGGQLAAVHVKDAVFPPVGPRRPTALGEGQMEYGLLRDWLHRAYPDAALLRDEGILPCAAADLQWMKRL